ncbi:hypothetical protein [Neotamlana laminarinivorans]|uniref:Periplasmic heavy metal sensor n=1 Tax=Neotamlana laminarinivorans TaxID=2883124 RepID=A0A9X1L3Y7_9FLAO|nr:hypothetical protein [Tamlana laminarinivorans]MCB4798732.1 hypothetical protein [Tamlana laminarinivorans]
MKNNSILYVLLFFLIIVNGFFIFNYLSGDKLPEFIEPKSPQQFIGERLGFNDAQKAKLAKLEESHHKELRKIGDDTKFLKDKLFNKLSDKTISQTEIDSITKIIGENEAISSKKIFYYFKEIEAICNSEEQRKVFRNIIQDAIGKPKLRGMPPNAHRPPPNGREGRMPPPEHQ